MPLSLSSQDSDFRHPAWRYQKTQKYKTNPQRVFRKTPHLPEHPNSRSSTGRTKPEKVHPAFPGKGDLRSTLSPVCVGLTVIEG